MENSVPYLRIPSGNSLMQGKERGGTVEQKAESSFNQRTRFCLSSIVFGYLFTAA
jgi:hypothetical protein